MDTLGSRVRFFRKKRNITMKELAERVGVSQTTISFLENDKRTISMLVLKKIAKELNVEYRELLKNDEEYFTPGKNIDNDNKLSISVTEEESEKYIKRKKEYFSAIRLSNPDIELIIRAETEPTQKLLEMDEDDKRFLTTFHNRAIRSGLSEFFDNYREELTKYIMDSYDKEAERLKNQVERTVSDSPSFDADDTVK